MSCMNQINNCVSKYVVTNPKIKGKTHRKGCFGITIVDHNRQLLTNIMMCDQQFRPTGFPLPMILDGALKYVQKCCVGWKLNK